MGVQRRIQTQLVSGVTVVTFLDRKILDTVNIRELGDELFALVEQDGLTSLVLDLQAVQFLASAALSKLIVLDRKVKGKSGKLILCSLKPEIQEVIAICRLPFDIRGSVDDAVAVFKS